MCHCFLRLSVAVQNNYPSDSATYLSYNLSLPPDGSSTYMRSGNVFDFLEIMISYHITENNDSGFD